MNTLKEYIICSAIYYRDGKKYEHQPKNITSGFVVCGRRHHNCFMTLFTLTSFNKPELWESGPGVDKKIIIQGFLTNSDSFVTRECAFVVAYNAEQILRPVPEEQLRNNTKLFSEDLY